MTHISPWAATEGLVAAAASLLRRGGERPGLLAIYGPFKLHGEFTTDSNRAFHERLIIRWARAKAGRRGMRSTLQVELYLRAPPAVLAGLYTWVHTISSTLCDQAPTNASPLYLTPPAMPLRGPLSPSLLSHPLISGHSPAKLPQPLAPPRPPSNPEWGYRDTDAIAVLAARHGLKLAAIEPMPANNLFMLFRAEGAA